MIATLEQIALSENLPFRYGTLPEENATHADDEPAGDWLFQEGYLNGTMRINDDNTVILQYNVTLWLLADSRLAHLPQDRGPELIAIMARLTKIYRKLANHGEVGTASFREGINLLDRNLDGIRLFFTFTPNQALKVC